MKYNISENDQKIIAHFIAQRYAIRDVIMKQLKTI